MAEKTFPTQELSLGTKRFEEPKQKTTQQKIQEIFGNSEINNLEELKKHLVQKIIKINTYFQKEFKSEIGRGMANVKYSYFDDDIIKTGCGTLSSKNQGPFYCPANKVVYINTTELINLLYSRNLKGEAALEYVLAHEYGHHIQNMLFRSGDTGLKVLQTHIETRYQRTYKLEDLSNVRGVQYRRTGGGLLTAHVKKGFELWADFFAGQYLAQSNDGEKLSKANLDELLIVVKAFGDDRDGKFKPKPEDIHHGLSKERLHFFLRGYTHDFKSDTALLSMLDGTTIEYSQVKQTRNLLKKFKNALSKKTRQKFSLLATPQLSPTKDSRISTFLKNYH